MHREKKMQLNVPYATCARKSCREWTSMRKPARIEQSINQAAYRHYVSYLYQTIALVKFESMD